MSVRDPLASPVVPAPASPIVTTVASIAALKALAGTDLTGTVEVLSYYTSAIPDGGGGEFTWNATDTRSDNGGTIIQPTAGGIGRWNRTASDITAKYFGAVGDGVTDDYAKIQAAGDALSVGGRLIVPAGSYVLSATPTWDKPIVIIGDGAGIASGKRPTRWLPAAGISGLSLGLNAQFSKVKDIYFLSSSTGAGTDDGIVCKGHGTIFESIVADNFGRYGFNFDTTTSGNFNNGLLIGCRAVNNRSHGFYNAGVNSNVVQYIQCDATTNGGYGFWNNCGSCVYSNSHSDGNTSGAHYDNGNSNMYLEPYVEGTASATALFDTSCSSLIWLSGGFANPVITNNGTNVTILQSGLFELIRSKHLELRGIAAPDIKFIPSSGATKNAQIYQSADSLNIADSGVADRIFIDLATGTLAVGGVAMSTSTRLMTPAGTTGASSLRIPHGAAPTSPVNGDVWTTTAGIFVRVNGATVGPLT